jgi:2-dehydro-3-deoxygluconokinase
MSGVVTFGETMAALHGIGPLRLGGSLGLSVAGSESNVAIGLARMGHAVRWIGRVGADELGALVVRTLRAEGVDVSGVIVDERAPTGVLVFERRIADHTRVSYYRAGSAGSRLCYADVIESLSRDVSVLHVTGVTAALGADARGAVVAAVPHAHELGLIVSLDVNFRSQLCTARDARTTLRPLLPYVDVLFASEDELPLVARDGDEAADADAAAHGLVEEGVPTVIVKRGGAGATLFSADGKVSAPARNVPVMDVVGAGDAFVAGFLSARLDGADDAAALERGVVLGAFAVSRVGDWEALPTRAELGMLDAPPGTTVR